MQTNTTHAPSILDNLTPDLNWLVVDTPLVRLFNSPSWAVIKHQYPEVSDLALLEMVIQEYALHLEDLEVEVN